MNTDCIGKLFYFHASAYKRPTKVIVQGLRQSRDYPLEAKLLFLEPLQFPSGRIFVDRGQTCWFYTNGLKTICKITLK